MMIRMINQVASIVASRPIRAMGLLFFFLFWITSLIVPIRYLGEIVNGVRFTVATSVAIAYFPAAWRALLADRMSDSQQLVLGLEIAWMATATVSAWSTIGRLFGFPTSVVENDFTASLIFLIAYGGLLHLTAPGVTSARVPIGNMRWVALSVGTGLLLGGVLLGLSLADVLVD